MAEQPLRIGPLRLDERIDPGDPDSLGGLANPKIGAGYDSLEILNRNRAEHARLAPVLALSHDEVASQALDHDEVEEVAGVPIEDASVKGRGEGKMVVYITRVGGEMGRSVKGALPYSDLPRSQAAYADLLERDQRVAAAVREIGGADGERAVGADPRVSVLEGEIARLRAELASVAEAPPSVAEQRSAAKPSEQDTKPKSKPSAAKAPAKKPAGRGGGGKSGSRGSSAS